MAVILLVDDDKAVLDMMVIALSFYLGEHVIVPVSDPISAIAECKKQVPDLLITDVRMPDLKGTELAAIIKETYPQVKVLYVSGYHEGLVDERVDNIVHKPFSLPDFVAKIKSLLSEENKDAQV